MLKDPASIALAAFFSFLGISISIYQILCHLRNYTEPVFQRYIIRIIFMVPVYAIGSFCSLQWRDGAIYFVTLRDCYEAWIIYNFSSLLLAFVGGPGAVVVKAEGKVVHPSWPHLTCCLPAMQVDGFFLRRCKQGTLQFVLLKPVMAALTLLLYAAGAYTDGDMSPDNGYFYISVLYNVCYTLALYGLILFWNGASELLQPFNPLLKFILVKTVVFLTFWQGIGISAINSMGEISDPEDGQALQNFMICCEMALAGIALLYAFPHKEYQIGGSTSGFRLEAFTHAISIHDVVKDAIHVFAPSYSDYVLYSDGGPADNVKRKKFRGQKGAGGDHPKAGKPMTNMDEGEDSDGRRSKTPNGGGKLLEANRNQAILLDSDSDGIDSEDEGSVVCGTDSDPGASGAGSDADDSNTAPRTRGTTTQSMRTTPRATQDNNTAEAGRKLQKKSSSRRMKRGASGRNNSRQTQEGMGGKGLIKASYPTTPDPAAAGPKGPSGHAAAASAAAVLRGHSRRVLPIALLCKGPILSDSDSEDETTLPAAKADKAGLLAPGHVDSAAAVTATPNVSVQAAAGSCAAAEPAAAAVLAAPKPPAVVLIAPPSRGKAAAVRQAVAGAAQAAGRAMAAAQAGSSAAGRQVGGLAVMQANSGTQPIVLTPPRRAAADAAGVTASPRSAATVLPPQQGPAAAAAARAGGSAAAKASAVQWEPAFPGAESQEQEQQGAAWADSGWSNVAL